MTSNELEIFKQSILDDVRVMMQTTGQVTQYIGARYVPLFADPLEWSDKKEYEPLTIVLYQGNSYTSRQFVPSGISIENTDFWAKTGNYNAQVEQYRQVVNTFDTRITKNTTDISKMKPTVDANAQAIEQLNTHKILVIGDSWVDPNKGYGEVLAKELQKTTRAEVICKGYSGAGWGKPGEIGKTFENLIDEVIALPNRDDYDCVIFIGGINNGKTPESSLSGAVERGLVKLQSNFKKVRYVINNSRSVTDRYFSSWQHIMQNASSNNHVPYSFICDYVAFSYYRDLSHLSNVGYCYLARYLNSLIYGGTTVPASSIVKLNGTKRGDESPVELKMIFTANFNSTGMGVIQINLSSKEISASEAWDFPIQDIEMPVPFPSAFNYTLTDNYGNLYVFYTSGDKIVIQPTYLTSGSDRTVNINTFLFNHLGLFFGA